MTGRGRPGTARAGVRTGRRREPPGGGLGVAGAGAAGPEAGVGGESQPGLEWDWVAAAVVGVEAPVPVPVAVQLLFLLPPPQLHAPPPALPPRARLMPLPWGPAVLGDPPWVDVVAQAVEEDQAAAAVGGGGERAAESERLTITERCKILQIMCENNLLT